MSFDKLLGDLLEARLRYEILRNDGSTGVDVVAARSRLHELRAQMALARLHS